VGTRPQAQQTEPASPEDIPKAGWRDVLRRSVKQFKRDDLTDRAAALTYYGLLAIFPGALVLVSILGLVGRSTTQKLLDNVQDIAPGGASNFLRSLVEQVQGKSGAASAAAIVGILLALWSASNYVASFMRASNAIYGVGEGRPIWKTAPVRLAVTFVLVLMLVACAIIVVVSGPIARQVGQAFGIGDTAVSVWGIAKWPVLLIIMSLMLSLLYKASPNVKQPGFRWVTQGGVLAVILWLIASGLFAVYVSFSGSYNKTYGSLGSLIIFLVWVWITNIAILLGAEFNAETQRQRAIEAGMPERVEPFVDLRDTRKLAAEEKHRAETAHQIRATETGTDPNFSGNLR
jgi:membrane protein